MDKRAREREAERERGQMACYVSQRPQQMFTSGEKENVTSHLEALFSGANGSENKLVNIY